MNYLKMILTGQRPLVDVWHYLVGNYRYKFFFKSTNTVPIRRNYFRWLLRSYIREQIKFRLEYIPDECWNTGSCKECGCQVPHLQMCGKSCDAYCYPEIMGKEDWESFMAGVPVTQNNRTWIFNVGNRKTTLVTGNTTIGYVSKSRTKLR